jgi:D-glycero-D-manno-heptose 1,7-bisphosphate phosphatase
MLLKAAEDFNIDLSQSWMIGDGENDIRAGIAAGCRTAFIKRENENATVSMNIECDSLFEAVTKILGG